MKPGFDASYFQWLGKVAQRHKSRFTEQELAGLAELAGDMQDRPQLASDLAELLFSLSRVAIRSAEDRLKNER